MKKTFVKRLVYIDSWGRQCIGGTTYDAALTDHNILGTIHEVGKTEWIGENLWLLRDGVPAYRITVQPFAQLEKSWYDLLLDAIRRI